MAAKIPKRQTRGFCAWLWPRDVEKVERIRHYLEEQGPGCEMGFADVVRFLLSQDCAKAITDQHSCQTK